MRIISESVVNRAVSMREAIEAMRAAFIDLSTGRADVPIRQVIVPGRHEGQTLIMPGYLAGIDALATKIVSLRPGNPEKGLPLIYGIVLLIDAATGRTLAVIDGRSLTAIRTGAASGLATDLLARGDSATLALFGAGVQAATQLSAVLAVRPIERIFVYARRRDGVENFIGKMRDRIDGRVELIAAGSASEAVRAADVVCTATTSETPVFDGEDLKAGTHVNAVGSFTPRMQEVDFATLRRSARIVVDSIPAAMHEAGDLIQAIDAGVISVDDIRDEIGQIAAGLKPGRTSEDEITYFKSVGNAAQDVALAEIIHRRAIELGLGIEVDL